MAPPTRPREGTVGGVFVGGASRRMGRDKGLLTAPEGGTLVARAGTLLSHHAGAVRLVGVRAAYREAAWPSLPDSPAGIGPIGGLHALLQWAAGRPCWVLACDMPYVASEDLDALWAASAEGSRSVVPRRDDRWEPFCALLAAPAATVVAEQVRRREYRLQAMVARLAPTPIRLPPAHLRDWDTPDDIE